jgi:ATP-binding cassette subfamily B (MDR/TAP) protein 11
MFKKLLRIPVSFYDKKENTPGAISTRLATDAYTLNNMISGVLAVVCLNLSTISLSLGIAFYYSWQLTLIVLGISPLIAISGAVNMALLKKLTQKTE